MKINRKNIIYVKNFVEKHTENRLKVFSILKKKCKLGHSRAKIIQDKKNQKNTRWAEIVFHDPLKNLYRAIKKSSKTQNFQ